MISDQDYRDECSHRTLVSQLRRAWDGSARMLADRLEACTFVAPCSSGACPLCSRVLQRVGTRINKLAVCDAAVASFGGRVSTLTIEPAVGRVAPGHLSAATYAAVRVDVQRILQAAHVPVAVGGIEALFDEVVGRDEEEHWQVLARINIRGWLNKEQEAELRRAGAVTTARPRAVTIDTLERENAGRSNSFRPERKRFSAYINYVTREAQDHEARSYDLRVWQRIALAQVEHNFGLKSRLLIHGVRADASRLALAGIEWIANAR